MQCRAWNGLINISTRLSFQFLPQNRPWAEIRGRKREIEMWGERERALSSPATVGVNEPCDRTCRVE